MTVYRMSAARARPVMPIAIIIATALAGLAAIASIVRSSNADVSLTTIILPLGLVLAPVMAVCAFRWPLIFPFGIYVALVPFDLLLSTGTAGTITRYVALASIAMTAIHIVATRKFVIAPKSWKFWAVLVGWMSLTALWSVSSVQSATMLGAVIPLFVLMTVVAVYPVSVLEMRAIIIAIIAGAMGSAAYGFVLFQHGQLAGDNRLSLSTQSGATVDPNFFATSFLLPIALCLSIALSRRRLFVRAGAALAILAMLASISLSGSRGAFISAGVVFVYFGWKSARRLPLLLLAAGAAALIPFFPTVLERFTESRTSASGSGRTFIWEVGAKALSGHWLGGTGAGTFPTAYDSALSSVYQVTFQGWSRPAHNVLVGESVELGLIGAVLVLVAWWYAFRQTRSISKNSPNYPLRLASEAAILALFVNALFIDPFVIKYYWLAFMLPMLLHNFERQRRILR